MVSTLIGNKTATTKTGVQMHPRVEQNVFEMKSLRGPQKANGNRYQHFASISTYIHIEILKML